MHEKLSFSDRVSLIVGSNGQGKTSLLEAVFFLAHAKSFRTKTLKELSSLGSEETIVEGSIDTADGTKSICCKLLGGSRQVYLNGSRVREASSFYGQLVCIEFTPDHLQIVKGQPTLRRTFLDRILAMTDTSYVDNLVAYQRALKNRNAVLKNLHFKPAGKDLLPWESLLTEHGRIVAEKRLELVFKLKEASTSNYRFFLSKNDSDWEEQNSESIDYELKGDFIKDGAVMSLDEILAAYEQQREKDIRRKSTSFGSHRDDIVFYLARGPKRYPARKLASQGQARCIALSLTLSAAEYLEHMLSESPIILLDDVISELDRYRRAALFKLLQGLSRQILITATEAENSLLKDLGDPALIEMSEGRIRPIKSA